VAAKARAKVETEYSYAADLIKVVDADTLDVRVDLGFHMAFTTRLRLYGVNAPEMSTPAGVAARDWVGLWLARHAKNGQVRILSRKPEGDQDKYGRYLAWVIAPGGACLNKDLLSAGHAVPYMI
jgi:micrococcal nuclease